MLKALSYIFYWVLNVPRGLLSNNMLILFYGHFLMFHFLMFIAFDISADLTELGRTPVALVCAGVKSILDIGLTLEYLVGFCCFKKRLIFTQQY